jgi:hypothetical protein
LRRLQIRLISTSSSGSVDLTRVRDDVNVIAKLTGDLFRPTFTFKLEFPSNNTIYNNPPSLSGSSR